MTKSSRTIEVYLEIGSKRTFAGALDWPGWCRSGRGEEAALQALVAAGPRYAHILRATSLGFQAPADVAAFSVVERLTGNATTDFGAPDIAPASDAQPVDDAELQRFQTILKALWEAFDETVQLATGKVLRTGPRGGGRNVDQIIRHVLEADSSYLARLAWKRPKSEAGELSEELSHTRQVILDALAAATRGETPVRGPRGGVIWTPRYFVRRVAWHALDHIWEIEDRS